jgi:hypothetical protein
MFVSKRKVFSSIESDWEQYKEYIKRPVPDPLYTIDGYLNSHISNSGSYLISDLSQLDSVLSLLPESDENTSQYVQLAVNLSKEAKPSLDTSVTMLGCDVCDTTGTSSLWNCGPWVGGLADITTRTNTYGLLSFEDAKLAQKWLPLVMGDSEPHAHVDIWLLYNLNL